MTEKLYYLDEYMKEFSADIISCEKCGERWNVILDQTAFYPEGGGQPCDQGYIGDAFVSEVHEGAGEIIHTVDRELKAGDTVFGSIDWERRFDHMQQHSGEHIVSGMICSAFDCDNIGFHMGTEVVQIDYNAEISREEVQEIEAKANQYIIENHSFEVAWPGPEELKEIDYRSKKELTGAVRITSWPGADVCACCGTHVATSGEIGLVKLLSVQKIKEGVRIEMLSGKRALDYLNATWQQNLEISRELSAKPKETYAAVAKLKDDYANLRYRLAQAEEKVFESIAKEYDGAENPLVFIPETDSDGVRKLCDMLSENCTGRCCVFAGDGESYKYAVIEKGEDIRDFIKEMNAVLNGRGGGKSGFAQGSVQAGAEKIRSFLNR